MFSGQQKPTPNRTTAQNQQTTTIRPLEHQDECISGLRDSLISLQYRIRTLQSQMQTKVERQQCFSLLDRKANVVYVKKGIDELYARMQADRAREEKALKDMQKQQGRRVQELKKKLKQSNTRQLVSSPQSPLGINFTTPKCYTLKTLLPPQQLYLQSNQTMFSLLIDEIKQLKHSDSLIQRLIESKHKKTIGLNNEVCRKLQRLEEEMEEIVRYIDYLQGGGTVKERDKQREREREREKNKDKHKDVKKKGDSNMLSKKNDLSSSSSNINAPHVNYVSLPKSPSTKKPATHSEKQQPQQQLLTQKHPARYEHTTTWHQAESFQSIRFQLITKSLQTIQKQLTHKINIKDLLPLMKQNIPNIQQPIQEMKLYIEENFQSMRKILQNQAQINEEIAKTNKIAWYHCYEKFMLKDTDRQESEETQRQQNEDDDDLGYIIFGQEMVNVMPECVEIDHSTEYTLNILAKGWYLCRLYVKEIKKDTWESKDQSFEELSAWIEVNSSARYPVHSYRLMNLAKDSTLRIITAQDDVFVEIQKL